MPNIVSNSKSLKKDKKRHLFKMLYKKKLKKVIKLSFEKMVISDLYKNLDSQLSKGLIKKNKCNRLKSKYMKKMNSLKS